MGNKKHSPRKLVAHESKLRWAGYAKAAGMGAFALGVAAGADADAAIVNHGAKVTVSPVPGTLDPLVLPHVINPVSYAYRNKFDIDGDGTWDMWIATGNYGSASVYNNPVAGIQGTIFTSGDPNAYAEAFAQGAIIDGTSNVAPLDFGVRVLNPGGTFGAGDTGLMGFQTSLGYFGWMSISLEDVGDQGFNGINDLKLTINDFAYENTGAGIPAGVPEPNSLALLAAGSIGLLARRRRMNAAS